MISNQQQMTIRQERQWLVRNQFLSRMLYGILLAVSLVATSCHGQQQQQHVQEAVIDPHGSVTTTESDALGTSNDATENHHHASNPDTTTKLNNHGVDRSWPMHYFPHNNANSAADSTSSSSSSSLSQVQSQIYQNYMQGCEKQAKHCIQFESDRIEMNLQQPRAMENYTYAGFAKVSTPVVVHELLTQLWQDKQDEADIELWDPSNTYVNHWEIPTKLLDIKQYLNHDELWTIIKAVQPVLEAWTQKSLILTSIYGIRAYYKGAILAPHVDRLPLVTSCIIHVASSSSSSSTTDPWILEVIDHDGRAHNVTMEPGDMVLYESHSVIHGRPYPLQADYYANIFLHFEPIGHTIRHAQKGAYGTDVQLPEQAERAYEQALAQAQQQRQAGAPSSSRKFQYGGTSKTTAPSSVPDLPNYVSPTLSTSWKQHFHFERNEIVSPKPTKQTLGLLTPHLAAADGLLEALKEIAAKDRSKLFQADGNGWRPLHEAARSGHADVVEYLLKEGAQVNERTNNGMGGNALWWAEKKQGRKNKETAELLKKYGAVKLAPKPFKNKE